MGIQEIASIISAVMFVVFVILGAVTLKKDKAVAWAFFSGAFLCGYFLITQILS